MVLTDRARYIWVAVGQIPLGVTLKHQLNRRRLLASAGALMGAHVVGPAYAVGAGASPRAVGISDFIFGVGADDGNLIAMNGWTGRVEHRIASPIEIVTFFANRPADRLVGVDGNSGQIAIFQNPGIGGAYVEPMVHKTIASPDLFAFSPDGRHAVYAAFGDGQIVLFDLEEGNAVRSFSGFEGVHDIRFSSLTGMLTITSLDRSDVRALDVRTGDVYPLINIADPDQRGIDHMSQTLSGRTGIVIRPGDPFAHLVAIKKDGASLLRSIELSGPPLRAYVSSDNRHVLLPSTQAPVVDIIDLNSLQPVAVIEAPGLITNVHTDPLSRTMIGIAPDADAVIAFDMSTLTAQTKLKETGNVSLLALNEESGLAFVHSGGRSQKIELLQVRGRQALERLEPVEIDQPLWAMTSTNALAVCH